MSYTAKEKIELVLASLRNDVNTAELCRRAGVSRRTLYAWRNEFVLAGRRVLEAKSRKDSRVSQLEEENQHLKQLVLQLLLERDKGGEPTEVDLKALALDVPLEE